MNIRASAKKNVKESSFDWFFIDRIFIVFVLQQRNNFSVRINESRRFNLPLWWRVWTFPSAPWTLVTEWKTPWPLLLEEYTAVPPPTPVPTSSSENLLSNPINSFALLSPKAIRQAAVIYLIFQLFQSGGACELCRRRLERSTLSGKRLDRRCWRCKWHCHHRSLVRRRWICYPILQITVL